jgi:hypothetical protein
MNQTTKRKAQPEWAVLTRTTRKDKHRKYRPISEKPLLGTIPTGSTNDKLLKGCRQIMYFLFTMLSRPSFSSDYLFLFRFFLALSTMRLLLLFYILEPLFKLSGSKPLKKQNKTKNIDLLNAHLKTEQFIGRKILCPSSIKID